MNAVQVSVSFQADAHGVLWSGGDPHSAGIHRGSVQRETAQVALRHRSVSSLHHPTKGSSVNPFSPFTLTVSPENDQ